MLNLSLLYEYLIISKDSLYINITSPLILNLRSESELWNNALIESILSWMPIEPASLLNYAMLYLWYSVDLLLPRIYSLSFLSPRHFESSAYVSSTVWTLFHLAWWTATYQPTIRWRLSLFAAVHSIVPSPDFHLYQIPMSRYLNTYAKHSRFDHEPF